MTGAAVAFAGVIGFVGLLVPHAARAVVGNDQRTLLPVSALAGAALLVAADASRAAAFAPAELPDRRGDGRDRRAASSRGCC